MLAICLTESATALAAEKEVETAILAKHNPPKSKGKQKTKLGPKQKKTSKGKSKPNPDNSVKPTAMPEPPIYEVEKVVEKPFNEIHQVQKVIEVSVDIPQNAKPVNSIQSVNSFYENLLQIVNLLVETTECPMPNEILLSYEDGKYVLGHNDVSLPKPLLSNELKIEHKITISPELANILAGVIKELFHKKGEYV